MKRIVCIILMSIFLCACAAAETGEKLTAEYLFRLQRRSIRSGWFGTVSDLHVEP